MIPTSCQLAKLEQLYTERDSRRQIGKSSANSSVVIVCSQHSLGTTIVSELFPLDLDTEIVLKSLSLSITIEVN